VSTHVGQTRALLRLRGVSQLVANVRGAANPFPLLLNSVRRRNPTLAGGASLIVGNRVSEVLSDIDTPGINKVQRQTANNEKEVHWYGARMDGPS
jgi:hypothetical protein